MCLACAAVDEVVVVTYWDGCSVGSFVVEEDRTSMHAVTIIFGLRCFFVEGCCIKIMADVHIIKN